jgi:hypothetical protein
VLLPPPFHLPRLPPSVCAAILHGAPETEPPWLGFCVLCFVSQNPTPAHVKEQVPQPTPPASKTHTPSLQHRPPYLNTSSAFHRSPKSSPAARFWLLNTPPAVCAQSATTTLSTPHPTPPMRSPIPKYEPVTQLFAKMELIGSTGSFPFLFLIFYFIFIYHVIVSIVLLLPCVLGVSITINHVSFFELQSFGHLVM